MHQHYREYYGYIKPKVIPYNYRQFDKSTYKQGK